MALEEFDERFGGESIADEEAPFDTGGVELTGPPRSSDFETGWTSPLATVLVVDDDPTKLKFLADKARKIFGNDIGVISTGNLYVVISMLRNGVSAVLTDYELGDFTGRDVSEFAIEQGVPASRILVATGNPESARAVVPEGVEVFGMPHELDALNAALRSLGRRLRGFIGEA